MVGDTAGSGGLPQSGVLRKLGFGSHPQGLSSLFFAELWERFSYYGMRALLVLFMVAPVSMGGMGFETREAGLIYGNYTMAVYMVAILGGFVADKFLGTFPAVLIGGFIIMCGHFSLAVPSHFTFFLGLILIVIGTSLFKPNVSALVGKLYVSDDDRRDAGFSIFYMGINIGAFIAPLVTGFLAQSSTFKSWLADNGFDPNSSWHWGFGAAGVGMALGLLVLYFRRHQLGVATGYDRAALPPITQSQMLQTLGVLLATAALFAVVLLSDREGFQWLRSLFVLGPAAAILWFASRGDLDGKRMAAVFVFFIAAMIFWAIFEQAGVTIALFAEELTQRNFFGWEIPSAWFQSLNPLFVILLAPIFATAWVRLGSKQPSSPVKFTLGLFFLGLSFLLMVPAAYLTVNGHVSPLWLVALFFLQTVGELFLSPVGLSTMTKLAPVRFVGLVLGVWFLAAAFGSKLAGVLGGAFTAKDPEGLAWFFLTQAGMVGVAFLLLLALTPWVKRLMGGVH